MCMNWMGDGQLQPGSLDGLLLVLLSKFHLHKFLWLWNHFEGTPTVSTVWLVRNEAIRSNTLVSYGPLGRYSWDVVVVFGGLEEQELDQTENPGLGFLWGERNSLASTSILHVPRKCLVFIVCFLGLALDLRGSHCYQTREVNRH